MAGNREIVLEVKRSVGVVKNEICPFVVRSGIITTTTTRGTATTRLLLANSRLLAIIERWKQVGDWAMRGKGEWVYVGSCWCDQHTHTQDHSPGKHNFQANILDLRLPPPLNPRPSYTATTWTVAENNNRQWPIDSREIKYFPQFSPYSSLFYPTRKKNTTTPLLPLVFALFFHTCSLPVRFLPGRKTLGIRRSRRDNYYHYQ